ncbi:MAG: hypothetical protein BGO88_14415 [Flavobacterium sp. 38-13]|uniref:hypothetical protein n=1 Tax=Flavobacterium sp. 38-13 TaxID=1896168 RepID=UPI000968E909|nr:hypothetical protein [Flavobacterium sp. 38-13]OJX49436.1 MAG: hypothetical protein BGO88_14415 [Flavobacterium sp. 38-13]
MELEVKNKIIALENFFKSMKALRDEKILINKKDFTCQIGEWLVEVLYNGKRAQNGIQKGWDVQVNNKYIQVKTHAKASNNTNRWSAIEKESSEKIDELIIIIFSPDYKLKEFYKVPWEEAILHINLRGKQKPRHEINWSSIKQFQIQNNELPNQELISFLS